MAGSVINSGEFFDLPLFTKEDLCSGSSLPMYLTNSRNESYFVTACHLKTIRQDSGCFCAKYIC